MTPTRTGKIARLPKALRDELNQRLVDGEPASEILDWLNHCQTVEDVMAKYFNCQPINKQNLSDWRQGGHQDWLREQHTLAFASQLVERSGNLAEQLGHQRLPDHFAALLATEFIKLAENMLDEHQDNKQRWVCLCEIQQQLSRLRRDDHRAVHASIKQERWARQVKAEDEAAVKAVDKEERRQNVLRYRIWRMGMIKDESKLYGNDDIAEDISAMSLEEDFNLKFGLLGRKSDPLALRKDVDEHIYPWRRPVKKPNPKGRVPAPIIGRVPNINPSIQPSTNPVPSPTPTSDTVKDSPSPQPAASVSPDPSNSSDVSGSTNPSIQPSINPAAEAAFPAPCRPRRFPVSPETATRPNPTCEPSENPDLSGDGGVRPSPGAETSITG